MLRCAMQETRFTESRSRFEDGRWDVKRNSLVDVTPRYAGKGHFGGSEGGGLIRERKLKDEAYAASMYKFRILESEVIVNTVLALLAFAQSEERSLIDDLSD